MNKAARHAWAILALLPVALVASACTGPDAPPAGSTTTPATSAAVVDITVTDAWVKAAGATDAMTAAFAVITNAGDVDAQVIGASSPAAGSVEVHEVAAQADGSTVMRPNPDGVIVPAHGTIRLEPGSDHLMLMQLSANLEPGTVVPMTLTLADGRTIEVSATVKDYAGANENYGTASS